MFVSDEATSSAYPDVDDCKEQLTDADNVALPLVAAAINWDALLVNNALANVSVSASVLIDAEDVSVALLDSNDATEQITDDENVALLLVNVVRGKNADTVTVANPDAVVAIGRTAFAVNVAKPKADGIDENTSNCVDVVDVVARAELLDATEIDGVTDIVALALLDVEAPNTAAETTVANPERLDAFVTGNPPIGAPSLTAIKAMPTQPSDMIGIIRGLQ